MKHKYHVIVRSQTKDFNETLEMWADKGYLVMHPPEFSVGAWHVTMYKDVTNGDED